MKIIKKIIKAFAAFYCVISSSEKDVFVLYDMDYYNLVNSIRTKDGDFYNYRVILKKRTKNQHKNG